jgi:ABC-type glycerol-3-phosphate transport system substrate-binding protein
LGIKNIIDLSRPGVKFTRVTGEKIWRPTAPSCSSSKRLPWKVSRIAQKSSMVPSSTLQTADGTETIQAVMGKADAAVVYYSAAVAAQANLDIVRFPASVNLSDKIQNAVTVPGMIKGKEIAVEFVKFMISSEGRNILKQTGQPPVVPVIRKGVVPAEIQ